MKLLVGTLTDGRCSGIDAYLLDLLAFAQREGVRMDFLTNRIDSELKERLDRAGSKLLETPSLRSPLAQYRAIRRILERGHYDAAYFNVSEPLNCVGALAAHKGGLPTIVHAHGSAPGGGGVAVRAVRRAISALCRPVLNRSADVRLSCSHTAARWLFGRLAGSAEIVYNPVDADRFAFDPEIRRQVRGDLALGDALVLGHVGALQYPKNQALLLDLTAKLIADGRPTVTLLIGDGPDEHALRGKARLLGIGENVRFLGARDDVDRLLQAVDLFVFPSFHEGLPIALLEAQLAGLPCLVSDAVDPDAILTENATFLSPGAPIAAWEEAALAAVQAPRASARIPADRAARLNPACREEILRAKLFAKR